MKICIVLGTRPEIIKMSPIIRLCEKEQLDYFIVHTGQHYSVNMDRIFFEELELPQPRYNLEIGSKPHEQVIGGISSGLSPILREEKPDIIFVQGDTSTVLGGAVAASRAHIKLAHVEAGLRSHDYRMIEEFNRITTDNLSDFLFCPTKKAAENPELEGISPDRIFVTGNTIVDAVFEAKEIAGRRSKIMERLKLEPNKYCLMTIHRAENVDEQENLESIMKGIAMICEKNPELRFILPLHPRTKKRLDEFGFSFHESVELLEPLGYMDFMRLEMDAKIIMTDSGGIQEEAFILGVPCVTLRMSTERPETVEAGANVVTGYEPERIVSSFRKMKSFSVDYNGAFGDGTAAQKMMRIIQEKVRR